jgi:HTH-type transcriptional regulator / antitoxin HigA
MEIDTFRTPGQLIQTLLSSRGWTQQTLATILEMSPTAVNMIITGKRTVNAEMAILLGDIFGLDPEPFLELQKRYDLARARITARPDPARSARAQLFGDLPIAEMIKRGWLDTNDVRDVPKVESALSKFFGVESVNEIEILTNARTKKTATFTEVTPAQLAWIYRVKQIAAEMVVPRYSPTSVKNAVVRLTPLLSAAEEARKAPRIIAESGIRYVIVESLSSTRIDGVCFWLNDMSPVIGMSLRFDRIDNFWFVLRHEIEHVLRGHGRSTMMIDAELEGERTGIGPDIVSEERVANEAAANFCVPQKKIESFIARKSPYFNQRDILGFARTLQIHPGLIAGQLQHRIGRYDRFRQHLAKIRYIVAPNAVVDGWGDVAPTDY